VVRQALQLPSGEEEREASILAKGKTLHPVAWMDPQRKQT